MFWEPVQRVRTPSLLRHQGVAPQIGGFRLGNMCHQFSSPPGSLLVPPPIAALFLHSTVAPVSTNYAREHSLEVSASSQHLRILTKRVGARGETPDLSLLYSFILKLAPNSVSRKCQRWHQNLIRRQEDLNL